MTSKVSESYNRRKLKTREHNAVKKNKLKIKSKKLKVKNKIIKNRKSRGQGGKQNTKNHKEKNNKK